MPAARHGHPNETPVRRPPLTIGTTTATKTEPGLDAEVFPQQGFESSAVHQVDAAAALGECVASCLEPAGGDQDASAGLHVQHLPGQGVDRLRRHDVPVAPALKHPPFAGAGPVTEDGGCLPRSDQLAGAFRSAVQLHAEAVNEIVQVLGGQAHQINTVVGGRSRGRGDGGLRCARVASYHLPSL